MVEQPARPFAERNIPVAGCKEGKVVGDEREVRVLEVQHIKGLEFSAMRGRADFCERSSVTAELLIPL
jgi:hypothetical protein